MDVKSRFSNRVDNYVKYRPGYPAEAIDYLYASLGFASGSRIADIGSGTGIFTRLLLERGSFVTALEPNADMRAAAEREHGDHPQFRSEPGSAEATGLSDAAVDFIVCAQSFHWFDREATRVEFKRILKPGGLAVLIWNTRLTTGTPFLDDYERLLRTYGTDYDHVHMRHATETDLDAFFKSGTFRQARFRNAQRFDVSGLLGRLLSSSYIPVPGDPRYEPMAAEAKRLFGRHERDGWVDMAYETEIYAGEPA